MDSPTQEDVDAVQGLLCTWNLPSGAIEKVIDAGFKTVERLRLLSPEFVNDIGFDSLYHKTLFVSSWRSWQQPNPGGSSLRTSNILDLAYALQDEQSDLPGLSPQQAPGHRPSTSTASPQISVDEQDRIASLVTHNRIYKALISQDEGALVALAKKPGTKLLDVLYWKPLLNVWEKCSREASTAAGHRRWKVSSTDFHRWSQEIVECFTGENPLVWYNPRGASTPPGNRRPGLQKPSSPHPHGRLYNRYNNAPRKLKAPGQATSESSCTLTTDEEDISVEQDKTQEERSEKREKREAARQRRGAVYADDEKRLLKEAYHGIFSHISSDLLQRCPETINKLTSTFLEAWRDTARARNAWLKANVPIEEYIETFPVLRHPKYGKTLVKEDFFTVWQYETPRLLCLNLLKWRFVFKKAVQQKFPFRDANAVSNTVHVLLDLFDNAVLTGDLVSQCEYILLVLPFLLEAGPVETSGHRTRSTPIDASRYFILRAANQDEVDKFIELRKTNLQNAAEKEHKKKKNRGILTKEELQVAVYNSLKPFIIGYGPTWSSISKYTIWLPIGAKGNIQYDFNDLLDAVNHFIFCSYAFHFNYPNPAQNVWCFVQSELMGIVDDDTSPPPAILDFNSYLESIKKDLVLTDSDSAVDISGITIYSTQDAEHDDSGVRLSPNNHLSACDSETAPTKVLSSISLGVPPPRKGASCLPQSLKAIVSEEVDTASKGSSEKLTVSSPKQLRSPSPAYSPIASSGRKRRGIKIASSPSSSESSELGTECVQQESDNCKVLKSNAKRSLLSSLPDYCPN